MSVFLVFIYYMVTEVLGLGSPAPEETANSYFNDAERTLILDYCKKTTVLKIIAGNLKDSFIARGLFHANITEKEVLNNKKFMKFLTDVIRLNLNDNCNFGTVVYNGKLYPICSDFELSDDNVKPNDWKRNKPKLFAELPNGVVETFVANRSSLTRKVKRDAENLVNHMGFVKPVKVTPTREAESRESVQGRVNEFMVS